MYDETLRALANLDWLQVHLDARLDFPSGAVLVDNRPMFLLEDLCLEGLTPATRPVVVRIPQPEDFIGKTVTVTMRFPEDTIERINEICLKRHPTDGGA